MLHGANIMMASSWVMFLVLSIQGGKISDLMGDNSNVAMGLAMAFSPSYTSSVSSPEHIRPRIRHDKHHGIFVKAQRRLHRIVAHSLDSSVSGDIVESANNQHVSLDSSNDIMNAAATKESTADEFDAVVNARYACTRFQRFKEPNGEHDNGNSTNNKLASAQSPNASLSDPATVQKAHQCMTLSQRAPTGFNAQPYRVILVHSKEEKERLAQYCLGRNADRVRDSDCTAVFLADRECGRDGRRYADFLMENMDDPPASTNLADKNSDDEDSTTMAATATTSKANSSRARRPLSPQALFKIRTLILLFSSGYPLPRFLAVPLSLIVRMGVSVISFFTRCFHSLKQSSIFSRLLPNNIQLLPTLSSAETWSQKNTMLVAMTYILACTSRGLATCPMEGVDASGVRKVLGIPRGRFSIPLIVSVGTPHQRKEREEEETDDVGLSHGKSMSPRYPLEEVVFGNAFGKPFLATS